MKPYTVDQPDDDFKPFTITIHTPELQALLVGMVGQYLRSDDFRQLDDDEDTRSSVRDLYLGLWDRIEGYDHD